MGRLLKQRCETLQQSINKYIVAKPTVKQKLKKGSTKRILPFLLLINGISLGCLSGNQYLIPILGIGFYSMPFVRKRKITTQDLKTALTTITNNYIASGNLKEVIQNCMPAVPEQYQPVFYHFLELPIPAGIFYLRNSLEVKYAKKWCDMLLLCQQDFSVHPLLLAILQEQVELDITYSTYEQRKQKIRRIFMFLSLSLFLLGTCLLLFQMIQGFATTKAQKMLIALFFVTLFLCFHGIWAEAKEENNEILD